MDKFLLQADHIWRVGVRRPHNGYCWVTGSCTIHYLLGLSNKLVDLGQYRTSSIKAMHKPNLGCDGQCNLEQCLSNPINKRSDPGLSFQTKDKYAWIRANPNLACIQPMLPVARVEKVKQRYKHAIWKIHRKILIFVTETVLPNPESNHINLLP